MYTSSNRRPGRRLGTLAFLLFALAMLWPALASAQTSIYCPAALTATVAWGGSANVDVTACQSGFGGVSGPFAPFAQHGTVTLGPATGGPQSLAYAHNGSTPAGGGSDTIWLEDDEGGTVRVDITITAPTSAITVSPATLPTLTAGTPFSQTLTSSGGTSPYTYVLESGPLPVGLSLTGAGVLSGTPTQRGGYSFSVRSTDSTAPTADTVVKSYTGTVQNPTLTLATPSGTAIQGAPFSQTLSTTGGVAPHSYQLETGSFPTGISISSAGVVSGTTAAAPGNYPVTLRVTDASTGPGVYYELESYTLTVSPPPSVSIGVTPASVSEDGGTNLTYTVERSVSLTSPTVVNITTSGTATSGSDYTGSAATVTIPAGALTATLVIDPTVDGTVESDETVTLTVAAGTGYTVGAPASATGTLLNDDVPSATISVSPAAVAEDGTPNLIYTVTLDQAATSATTLNYTIAGSAANGTDYATIASPLVITAGNTTGTITVDPAADTTIEADETVTLTLAAGTGYTVGVPNSATGTILNDDLPNLTIDDVTVNEGNAGITNFTFTVSLSAPAGPGGVTFDIATANGSATAGVDYVANSLTGQTIPAGSSTYTFTVQVNGDTANEPSETFFVNVTNVVNAVVVDGQGVGTVTNDDPLPSLSIDDVSVVEGNAGTVNAVFTVTLGASSGQTVSVNYATADGTATQPADYSSTSGTLTFTPGQTTRTITVPVIGETVPEANETFFVNLSGATNATIGDNQGVGTITNDDVPVTVSPATLPNGAVAAAYSQTVTASGGTGPYSFAVTAGALPAGVTLSVGGVLSGTPSAGGTFNFTVTASDSSAFPGPFAGSRAYTLTIAAPTIVLPATPLAGGTLGTAYSAAITPASGGSAPYSYAVTAGALPGGLTLNTATGAITGTPGALGTFNFSITATDSSTGTGPYTATQAYAITVIDAPATAGNSSLTVVYNAAATPVPLTLGGGVPTSLAIATAPAHGTAIVTGPASITYQPDAGYAGPDSFTYTATNSGGTSAPATVSVTVQDAVITLTASGGFAATVAAAYTQTFTFNGGTPPWSGYQVANLPAGLSITGTTANTVTVSGTPTQAGTFNLNVSATDGSTGNGPYTVGQAFALTVSGPVLTLAPASPALNGTYATPFTQTFSTTGGVGPYTYAVSGALPAGMSLSGDTLSGTPTAPGSYSFTITATDAGASGTGAPFTTSRAYTLEVAAPTLALTPATLPASTAGTVYSQAFSATGGVAPYSFAISSGSLPAGLSLTGSGTLSGTPAEAGTFSVSVTATDAYGQAVSRAYALDVAQPTLALTPGGGSLPNATAGEAFSQSLVVAGGIAPYTATLSGTLPTGITFNPATLAFAGTPTESGTFAFDVTATDSTGGTPGTVTATYSLTVLVPALSLSPETVPGATAGVAYTQAFVATGGVAPYQYALGAGTLPAGLSLNAATGQLDGTPTEAGSFDFSITATDSTTGTAASVTRAYTLAISAPTIVVDPETLPTALQSVEYAQALSARGGTAPYTFTLDAGTLPTGMTLSAEGALAGTPTETGSFEVTIRATDALGFSGTRTYALTVIARPDPTQDPEVRGLLEAQAEATRRFAAGQIANFQQRLEQLHGGATADGLRNGVSFTTRERCQDNRAYTDLDACGASARAADARRNAAGEQRLSGGASPDEEGTASQAAAAAVGFWTGGTLRSGNFDGRAGRNSLDFETEGVSAGADRRFRPDLVAGLGLGYGQDSTAIGDNGTQLDGKAWTLAMYGSYHPGERLFVDGLLGYQRLSYDLERFVTANDGRVRGSRDGDQWFASLSIGTDLTRGAAQLTPYARVDAMRATLDPYTERGDAIYALTYGEQDVDTTTGNIGLRMAFRRNATWGAFSPQARLEYQHDFTADSRTFMQYADLLGPTYATSVSGYDRSRFMLGLGVLFDFGTYSLQVDYRGVVGSSDQRDNALQLMFQAGR